MEDLTCSTTGRITVVKMAILPHTSYIFNTISQFHSILQEIEKNNLKFCLNTHKQDGENSWYIKELMALSLFWF